MSIFLKILYTVSICAIVAFTTNSQTIKFFHYTTDDGLSQGSVKAIIQDNSGFMWFGTDDGLNKFDGYSFTVFQNNPIDSFSISNNDVNAIIQDKDGLIWIGTNWGLNSYNPITNKFNHYLQNPKKEYQLSDNVIQCLFEDEYGIIWIGTENGGLVGFDKKIKKFTVYKQNPNETSTLPSNNVNCIIQALDGNIWIGTDIGFSKFKKISGLFVNYKFKNSSDSLLVTKNNKVTCIYEDSQERFWIGTDKGGINLFDRKTEQFQNFGLLSSDNTENKKNRIRAIIEDTDHKIWFATSAGLTYFDEEKLNFIQYYQNQNDIEDNFSLNFNDLYSLYKDKSGSIWVGTYGNGINVFHPKRIKFNHYRKKDYDPKEFTSNLIHGFAQMKDGSIIIGTNGGGLMKFYKKQNKIINLKNEYDKIHNAILSVYVDNDDIIWLGTWGNGLQKLDEKSKTIKTFELENNNTINNTILCIYEEDSCLWLGTYSGGLVKFNKNTEEIEFFNTANGLGSDKVFCITGSKSDTLFIGTRYGGLNFFNKKTKTTTTYMADKQCNNCISSNTVVYIYDDLKGNLWLATESGLNKFEKQSKNFVKYFKHDGLPNDHIYSIIPDSEGFLWLSTNKGLCRFNPNDSVINSESFCNYDVNDGLQGNEFNQCSYFQSRSGEFFFGGTNGFNSFFPVNLNDMYFNPPVYLTSFKIFDIEQNLDTNISLKKKVELTYKENFLSFEFVGLDYVFPAKNKFSYKMENLDEAWSNPSTRRYASYPNIQPGKYIFRVRTMNNNHQWSKQEYSIEIIIKPPFWKTLPFIVAVILFIILLTFLFFRLRIQSIKNEKKILEESVNQRTKELIKKNNDITSSIIYAKRIQEALLPEHKLLQEIFEESYIYYRPKDIVSGDFFWISKVADTTIIACGDCTGHGVPGAFMSIIGNSFLMQIVNERKITHPGTILVELNNEIINALHQKDGTPEDNIDGIDIAICSIKDNILEFAGANRPIYIITDNSLHNFKGEINSIGGTLTQVEKKYDTTRFKLKKGDTLYFFTDGFSSQFGGDDGKKYLLKNFKEFIFEISKKPICEQYAEIDNELNSWMSNHDQIDDILIIGIKI
ncbi:MAG: hypothetical protein A2033_17780 [Bacteroidetes bacterium GWA2_31_9]|nr:MAG: hypothetical protein A2033_17780 [Bacteroidetes bacterium GWA2_31_9]